jgi:hypothetical protein
MHSWNSIHRDVLRADWERKRWRIVKWLLYILHLPGACRRFSLGSPASPRGTARSLGKHDWRGSAHRNRNRCSSYFSVFACPVSQDACFMALLIQPEERKKLIHQRCYAYSTSTFPLMVHTAAVLQLYNSQDSEIRTEPVPVSVGGSSLFVPLSRAVYLAT